MRSFAGVLARIACLGGDHGEGHGGCQVTIPASTVDRLYGAGRVPSEFTSNFWNITDTGSVGAAECSVPR